jgi:hypothetical protein
MRAETLTVGQEETAVVRQRNSKHLSVVTYIYNGSVMSREGNKRLGVCCSEKWSARISESVIITCS